MIPRESYIDYLNENPGLTPMPREMRLDLQLTKQESSEQTMLYRNKR